MDLATVFSVLLGAAVIAFAAYYFILRPRAGYKISGLLDMQLFRVLLPRDENLAPGESQETQQKNAPAIMEQFFSSLSVMKTSPLHDFLYGVPAVAFELALPHVGEDVTFYFAVRRKFAQFVGDEIHSLFPSARVEPAEDYNIFHPTGVSVGSIASLKKNAVLSLRTHQDLGGDPLEVLVGAFAKMKKVGDGASVQFMVRPARKTFYETGKNVARKIRDGKSLSEAIGGAKHDAKNILKSEANRGESAKAVDEELARQIEAKAALPAFDVNVRLIASSATPDESFSLLQSLEAAFSQFANPAGNELKFKRAGGRALERLAYVFSFRMFSARTAIYLSTAELASFFHFPYAGFSQAKVAYLRARQAPPPTNLPESGLRLGRSVFRGESRDVFITDEDRMRHLYAIGQTGTGKSVFLKEMARQDIAGGRGVCFIDPHGDAVDYLLSVVPPERSGDVIYFNPGDTERPMALNFLEYDTRYPDQKTFIVDELLGIFNKLYNMSVAGGPMFEQYFRNSTLLVMEDPPSGNTLLEISRVLADKEFRDLKLSRTSNVVVRMFWQKIAEQAKGEASLKEMVPYITSKFDTFLSNEIMRPIIAQEKSAFNFREVMDSGKILLINLSKGRLGELNSNLLGLIIVGKILMASLSRTDVPENERKDFYLYIDEFQNVTTKSIATILSEARKYRLGLYVAHQFLGQLEEEIQKAVFGNVGALVSFRIGPEDGEFMERQFAPVFNARDLINIENFNAYAKILINGEPARPFNFKTYPPVPGDAAVRGKIIELSRIKYGRPRADIEESVRRKFEHV